MHQETTGLIFSNVHTSNRLQGLVIYSYKKISLKLSYDFTKGFKSKYIIIDVKSSSATESVNEYALLELEILRIRFFQNLSNPKFL